MTELGVKRQGTNKSKHDRQHETTHDIYQKNKRKKYRKLTTSYMQRSNFATCGLWLRIFKEFLVNMQMTKLQVVVILSVLQISSILCEGHECGDNPMKQVLLVAKRTGRTLSHVLSLLKEIDNPSYNNLSRQFRTYAACVGLVDTGYFRKRANPFPQPKYWTKDKAAENSVIKPPKNYQFLGKDEKFFIPEKMYESVENNDAKKYDENFDKKNSRKFNVERLKKWLYGPYRNYMNSYYLRWNLLWPLVNEE